MDKVRVIEIKQSVFKNNDEQAEKLRGELKSKGVFLLNLMSSPGSGKTTTLKATINALKDKLKIGVMEADIDSDVDAIKIAETGVKSIQLHTGGMCHLDAAMTKQGVEALGTDGVELAILENVGNLVCPAEFDTGSVKNVMILSVPEGDDLGKILELSAKIRDLYPDVKLSVSNGNCKISVFGEAMKGQPGVAAKVFAAAAKANTDIIMITTSEVDISMLVPQSDLTATLESIKGAFNN